MATISRNPAQARDRPGVDTAHPDTLQLQPIPIGLTVARQTKAGVSMTAIKRAWSPGDAALCRLCPPSECTVDARGTCLVLVPWHVPDSGAALCALGPPREGDAGPRVEFDPD
jgi:hypothetical protein